MSTSTTIELPWPPSVNNLFNGGGRRFISSGYRRWRTAAEWSIVAARIQPVAGPVRIAITLHPPDSRPRDADNYNKPILDALVRTRVIADDHRGVVRGVASEWGAVAKPSKRARAVVTINAVEGDGK